MSLPTLTPRQQTHIIARCGANLIAPTGLEDLEPPYPFEVFFAALLGFLSAPNARKTGAVLQALASDGWELPVSGQAVLDLSMAITDPQPLQRLGFLLEVLARDSQNLPESYAPQHPVSYAVIANAIQLSLKTREILFDTNWTSLGARVRRSDYRHPKTDMHLRWGILCPPNPWQAFVHD